MGGEGLVATSAVVRRRKFILDADCAVRVTLLATLIVSVVNVQLLIMDLGRLIRRLPAAASITARFRTGEEGRVKGTKQGSRTTDKDAADTMTGATGG